MNNHPDFKQVEASRPDFDADTRWTYTKVPDPNWKPGQGRNNHPESARFRADAAFKSIDPSTQQGGNIYKLLINGVVPRPIAFVSSEDANGVRNLAPFSYFSVVNHRPPLISVSVNAPGPGKVKDTTGNIKATKRFVVNIISETFIEAANYTAIDAPHDVSEWALSGLTPVPNTVWGGNKGGPPRVGESAFSMECELFQAVEIREKEGDEPSGTLILGKVKMFHVREDILNEDHTIDLGKLLPVSRLGGISYGRTIRGFEVPRPVWAKVKDTPEVQAALERGEKKAP